MRTLRTRHMALFVVTAALAVAGCGGSSHKSPSSGGSSGGTGTSAVSTPGSTTSTPGSTTGGSSGLTLTTPINSGPYRQLLSAALSKIPGLPTGDIPKVVNCAIQKLESQGLKTAGAVGTHSSQARADGEACAKALGLH